MKLYLALILIMISSVNSALASQSGNETPRINFVFPDSIKLVGPVTGELEAALNSPVLSNLPLDLPSNLEVVFTNSLQTSYYVAFSTTKDGAHTKVRVPVFYDVNVSAKLSSYLGKPVYILDYSLKIKLPKLAFRLNSSVVLPSDAKSVNINIPRELRPTEVVLSK